MTTPSRSVPPLTCPNWTAFDQARRAWSPDAPFPLLKDAVLDRYALFLADQGVDALPGVDTTPRPGAVVSVGGPVGEAAGHLLATATARPHEHVSADGLAEAVGRHGDMPVAVVGLFDDVAAAGDWPGMAGPRVGVVTARDSAALVCMIYRTLTVWALTSTADVVALHPNDPEAASADAVSFTELAGPLRGRPLRLFASRTHGEECAVIMPDGVICGRVEYPGLPSEPNLDGGRLLPTCMRGPACFIPELPADKILSAADVRASVVFAQSCAAVAVGPNMLPGDFGVGIGFTSGTAVAVVGAIDRRHAAPGPAKARFEAALNSGMALGDAVALINRPDHALGASMSRFGLIGDPTVVFPRTPAATAQSAPEVPAEDPLIERLAYWNSVVLPRIARLRWLGLPVDDARFAALRDELAATASGSSATAKTKRLVDGLVAIQTDLVAGLTEHIHTTWWKPENQLPAFRETGAVPVTCPYCATGAATRITFRHRLEHDLVLWTIQCRRCGEVVWSTAGTPGRPELAESGDRRTWVAADSAGSITRALTNTTAHEQVGGIGFALVNGVFRSFPHRWSGPLRLRPGARREVRWSFRTTGPDLIPHDHRAVFLSIVDGVFTTSPLLLCVPGDPALGHWGGVERSSPPGRA